MVLFWCFDTKSWCFDSRLFCFLSSNLGVRRERHVRPKWYKWKSVSFVLNDDKIHYKKLRWKRNMMKRSNPAFRIVKNKTVSVVPKILPCRLVPCVSFNFQPEISSSDSDSQFGSFFDDEFSS